MTIQVETFAKDFDAPAQISPELVLVAPPEEARAAREALAEPKPLEPKPAARPAPRAEAEVGPAATVEAAPRPEPPASIPAPLAPSAPPRRRRSPLLLLVPALVLAGGGFVVGRQLGDRHKASSAAVRPATAAVVPENRSTTAPAGSSSVTARRPSTASTATRSPARVLPPVVSWKARPGIRHYRLDIVRRGAVILTIMTDEPRVKIPLTWPNAGRLRHLSPGTYEWSVRAATPGPARVLVRGTVKVR